MSISKRDGGIISKGTSSLLLCGIAAGPFFYLVATIQILVRPAFHLKTMAISALSLGNLGWIQIANFIITGVLVLLSVVGQRIALRGSKAGTWGPILIGIFGLALVVGGIFHPDPAMGFPPGAPSGMPTKMTVHGTIHQMSFVVGLFTLIASCFVYLRRFVSQRMLGWAIYSAASGIVTLLFVVMGNFNPNLVGVIFFVGVAIAFGFLLIMSAYVRSGNA